MLRALRMSISEVNWVKLFAWMAISGERWVFHEKTSVQVRRVKTALMNAQHWSFYN